MSTWRERAVAVTTVAAVLVAGGGLAAGIRNALFESDSVKAGSFRPNVVIQADNPTTTTSSTVVVEETTTTTESTVPSTTTTVRSRTATTAARIITTTTVAATTTTVATTTSTTQENRGRGRGKPPDD